MKRLIQSITGLCLAFSLVGCCYSPGYVDSSTGVAYGGGAQPCGIPDPFALIFGCGCFGGCGWNGCVAAPAAPCAPTCAPTCQTAPYVGSYSGTAVSPTVIHSTPHHHAVPSVPAGVYEEATPEPQPAPPAEKTGSIIYKTHPVSGHHVGRPVHHHAHSTKWVPARL